MIVVQARPHEEHHWTFDITDIINIGIWSRSTSQVACISGCLGFSRGLKHEAQKPDAKPNPGYISRYTHKFENGLTPSLNVHKTLPD